MSIPEQEQERIYEEYEFGDLYVKCKCGNEDWVASGLEGGIRVDLYTTNSHTMKMECSKCGASLSLCFKEAKDLFKLKEIKAEKNRLETEEMIRNLEAQVTEEILDEKSEIADNGYEGWGHPNTGELVAEETVDLSTFEDEAQD